jgi:hypothetical protein
MVCGCGAARLRREILGGMVEAMPLTKAEFLAAFAE